MLGNWQEPMGGWGVEGKAGRPFPPPRARPVISGVVDELSRLRPRLFERDLRRRTGGTFVRGLGFSCCLRIPKGAAYELGPHRRQLGRSSRARFSKNGASAP